MNLARDAYRWLARNGRRSVGAVFVLLIAAGLSLLWRTHYFREHGVTEASSLQKQAPVETSEVVPDEALPGLHLSQAVVEQKQPCAVCLRTSDNRRLWIGGPGATKEVAEFVQLLEVGRSYSFPDAFLQYRMSRIEKR